MNIYRHKQNDKLYTIALVSPLMFLGSWYVASPFKWAGDPQDGSRTKVSVDDFDLVAKGQYSQLGEM